MSNQELKTEIELLYEISEKLDDLVASFLIQGKEKETQVLSALSCAKSHTDVNM